MEDHEVKYIPTKESNFLHTLSCNKWVQLKNRRSNNQLSLFISVLSLILALCFFGLVFTWLWGLPEKVLQNEEKISVLEEVLIDKKKLDPKTICAEQKAVGNCFASMPRWYFDIESKLCTQFEYTGCNGNTNNFHTENSCLSICGDYSTEIVERRNGAELIDKSHPLKQEGEECGSCFSPESNFHCGTCSPDLECKEDPISGPLLPDLPKKCRKKEEARNLKQEGETCGSSRREVCGVCENGLQCDAPMDACGHCINKKEHESTKEANCYDEPDTGKCRALIPRFYHDKNDGECKQFYYGGCGGNNNNYETMEDCRNKCMAKKNGGKIDQDGGLCKLPAAVGDCRAAIPRWYYNEASNICEEFIWGGCDGNDNNFASKSKCESRCKPMPVDPNKERIGEITSGLDSSTKSTTTNEICTLPEDGGRCRAVMERYRFDPEIHKCVVFQYGGCGGNENNFEHIEECEKTCI